MVLTKKDLDEGFKDLKGELQILIDNSIAGLRASIIDNLVEANKNLQQRVNKLEGVVEQLTLDFQANLQYQRQNNIIISGIPPEVDHGDLEKAAVEIVNTCAQNRVSTRDVQGCHRLSQKSTDVICRFVNKKPVEEALNNWKKIKDLDRKKAGLPDATGDIYISSHLTPYNAKLAYHCRQLKRKKLLNKISTKKGVIRILVTADENSGNLVWKTISSPKDILNIFPTYVVT